MSIASQLQATRKAAALTQADLAQRTGLSRMTVQRTESEEIDPRLSTVLEMARALGMDLMLVPTMLRPEMEAFLHSGGRLVGQPAGVGAPPSVVDALARTPAGAAGFAKAGPRQSTGGSRKKGNR